MTRKEQVVDFARKLKKERPDLKISLEDACRKGTKLYQLSSKLRIMYEAECSYPYGETEEHKSAIKALEERIDLIMKELKLNYKFQTDPRGTAVRIFWTYETPPPYNTMGGAEAGWGIG